MVTVTGGNSRMVREKDMQQLRVLMETDTLGNTVMIRNTGMEYTDGLIHVYITESSKRIREMGKDITGIQVVRNIGESSRITCYGEKESNKKREYITKTNTKMATVSAGVK